MKVTCWGALIYGICPFVDGTRAARRRAKGAPNLTNSTSDCAVLMATAWRTKRSGTAFSRFVLPRACQPFVARNELAIATKSIASVLSPRYAVAVGSLKRSAEGERRYGRDALSNPSGGRVVAKANEADCIAQTPKSKHVRKGEVAFEELKDAFFRFIR